MPLDTNIAVSVTAAYTGASGPAALSSATNISDAYPLTDGIVAGKADKIYTANGTTAASGTTVLDLAGVLNDAFGNALTMAKVKALYVKAAVGNTNDVVVTRPAANGVPIVTTAGAGVPVGPGGCFVWVRPDAAGVGVTPATGDLLHLVNSAGGTPVNWTIVIVGTSA